MAGWAMLQDILDRPQARETHMPMKSHAKVLPCGAMQASPIAPPPPEEYRATQRHLVTKVQRALHAMRGGEPVPDAELPTDYYFNEEDLPALRAVHAVCAVNKMSGSSKLWTWVVTQVETYGATHIKFVK